MTTRIFTAHVRAGLYHLPPAQKATVIAAASAEAIDVVTLDIRQIRTTRQGLQQLGNALDLPDWYAANFDALFDCLADPDWHADQGLLLVLEGLALWPDADDLETLLEVLAAACEARQAPTAPLWVIIDMPREDCAEFPFT
ncbi:barstar family protein [Dechloromonas sp.]|uniref:barstar family protein n=1 Tax=Dechloromonas sp. TaxID=1917218 RepID=UPI00120C873F|nr:barstar family protein [Dechloromonas sp.]MBU3696489.1 barstar family protein [Dechloromonas sp.]TEX46920.1 MAG: hypothetical protein CFR70_09830 [Rhodocyclaceae bacterium]